MFKLLRYYSAASLVAVLATAVMLGWFYRQIAVAAVIHLADRSNLNLAQTAMNPLKPALLQYLEAAADVRPGGPSLPLPPDLAQSINAVMHDDSFISRIKIYNPRGVVVFSTTPGQIGDEHTQNKGFLAAMRGGVGSELVYRDTFNSFDGTTEEDNLMQTYIPVRAGAADPIRGVFELYGDMNNLMHEAERAQFIVVAGATLILMTLYAVLVLIVRHANTTIEDQQRTISERNETLAVLSAHMLRDEESHKQKIAFELHERVAQTLTALKLRAECSPQAGRADDAPAGAAGSMVTVLQEAIQEIRTIATELRPASLDDLGLLPTLQGLCRQFQQRHPELGLECRIDIEEREVPAPLKGILYRIVMSALDDVAQHATGGPVHVVLELDDAALVLLVHARIPASGGRMEELATLSGGTFAASSHPPDGTTLRASWNR